MQIANHMTLETTLRRSSQLEQDNRLSKLSGLHNIAQSDCINGPGLIMRERAHASLKFYLKFITREHGNGVDCSGAPSENTNIDRGPIRTASDGTGRKK